MQRTLQISIENPEQETHNFLSLPCLHSSQLQGQSNNPAENHDLKAIPSVFLFLIMVRTTADSYLDEIF
jgi:hypothetical protein